MAGVVVALGLDTLLAWGLRLLAGLVVLGLMVALILVQTVAGMLAGSPPAGGEPGSARGAVTPVPSIGLPTRGSSPVLPGDIGASIVSAAQAWLGVPYAFGGCSRAGVDCSCLVQDVYGSVGIRLPRVAVDQFNATQPIANPEPGDLVFFANTYEPGVSHVGIYIGNGLQINAPTPGQVVSVAAVFTGYWGAHFVGAHRFRE